MLHVRTCRQPAAAGPGGGYSAFPAGWPWNRRLRASGRSGILPVQMTFDFAALSDYQFAASAGGSDAAGEGRKQGPDWHG